MLALPFALEKSNHWPDKLHHSIRNEFVSRRCNASHKNNGFYNANRKLWCAYHDHVMVIWTWSFSSISASYIPCSKVGDESCYWGAIQCLDSQNSIAQGDKNNRLGGTTYPSTDGMDLGFGLCKFWRCGALIYRLACQVLPREIKK